MSILFIESPSFSNAYTYPSGAIILEIAIALLPHPHPKSNIFYPDLMPGFF